MASNQETSEAESGEEEQNGGKDGGPHEADKNQRNLTQGKGTRKGSVTEKGRGKHSPPTVSTKNTHKAPSNTDRWDCDTCENEFADKSDMLTTCEYCGSHRCISCLGMTKTVYKAISGRPDLPWLCDKCVVKSLDSIRQTKSIETRCTDFITEFQRKVDERMGRLEKDVLDMKGNMTSMKDELMKEIKDTVDMAAGKSRPSEEPNQASECDKLSSEKIVQQAAHEMQSRMERANNVIIFNMKEPAGNLKDENMAQDYEELRNICKEINVDIDVENDVKSMKRIGKKGQVRKVHGNEQVVPRLTVVKFTEDVKTKVMKNAHKLRFSAEDYYKKIGLKHDMTKDERSQDAKLRRDAKDKQEAEEDANLLYLVRGPPWERKIIKVKKSAQREVPPELLAG